MNDVTPDNASFFHLPDTNGAIVAQVSPDSPASQAGLKSGDVIVTLDGQKVTNGSALQVAVSGIAPGNNIALGIIRDGSSKTVNLKVGSFHKDGEVASNDDSAPKSGKLGLAVADLDKDAREQLNIPSQVHGVAIQSVRPASPAEDAGLAAGDVILEVNRKPVTSAENFVSDVHANPADKDLLLLVWSKGNASYRVIHPDQG